MTVNETLDVRVLVCQFCGCNETDWDIEGPDIHCRRLYNLITKWKWMWACVCVCVITTNNNQLILSQLLPLFKWWIVIHQRNISWKTVTWSEQKSDKGAAVKYYTGMSSKTRSDCLTASFPWNHHHPHVMTSPQERQLLYTESRKDLASRSLSLLKGDLYTLLSSSAECSDLDNWPLKRSIFRSFRGNQGHQRWLLVSAETLYLVLSFNL